MTHLERTRNGKVLSGNSKPSTPRLNGLTSYSSTDVKPAGYFLKKLMTPTAADTMRQIHGVKVMLVEKAYENSVPP